MVTNKNSHKADTLLKLTGRLLIFQFIWVFLVGGIAVLIDQLLVATYLSYNFPSFIWSWVMLIFFVVTLALDWKMQVESQRTAMGLYSLVASLLAGIFLVLGYAAFDPDLLNGSLHQLFAYYLPYLVGLSVVAISIILFIRYRQATRLSILLSVTGCLLVAIGFVGWMLVLAYAYGTAD